MNYQRNMFLAIIINLIKFYQKIFSPDHGIFKNVFGYSRCRFHPSCSVYTLEAVSQYGLSLGIMLSLKRIFKCNPFNEGGYDPVVRRFE